MRQHNDTTPDAPGSFTASPNASVPSASPAPPYHLSADLFRGIVEGAYAVDNLHTPGLIAWILVGFVPVLGTLAAARDAYYSLEVREWSALLLNLIGLLPFMKGFANLLEVTQLHRLHRVAHAAHQIAHVARHGRKVRAGSRKAAAAITGISHEAGAAVLLASKRDLPLRNGAAWPALLLALVTALVFPIAMGLVLTIIAGSVYFAHTIPLPLAIGSGVVALLGSIGALVLAYHARRTASAMKGRPFSRAVVSSAAVWLAWLGLLESLAVVILILSIERGVLYTH